MSDQLCPLKLIAVAADVNDRLKNDNVGIDCPQNDDCAWWSPYDSCAIVVLSNAMQGTINDYGKLCVTVVE